jgi:hypothetical protein
MKAIIIFYIPQGYNLPNKVLKILKANKPNGSYIFIVEDMNREKIETEVFFNNK